MKILVTGGLGYIGSHTVIELLEKGHEVIILDNLSNSRIEVIDSIEKITRIRPKLIILDLVDINKTADFFKEYNNLDGVIHFAAYKSVFESVQHPLLYYQNNIQSLINILQGLEKNNILNIVFSSSCTVYGHPRELPVGENSPVQKANNPYGNTKQISEEIINDQVKVTNLNAINLRYFNPIGAHKSSLIGELPLGIPNNLMPCITQTAVGLHKYLSVFGDDYNTPDGTAIRDYIHVVDLAIAHVIAIERNFNKKKLKESETFNLGTGIGYSVFDVIKIFEKISKLKVTYKILPRRKGDIEKIWANPQLANKILGWKAEKDLEQMVTSAWNWEQSYRKKNHD